MACAVRLPSVAHAISSHQSRLCTAIQRHLRRHPHAADTAKGIVASWLPATGYEDAGKHIGAVLEALVEEGWLRPHALPDGNVLYVANPLKCSTSPRTS